MKTISESAWIDRFYTQDNSMPTAEDILIGYYSDRYALEENTGLVHAIIAWKWGWS